MRTCHFVNLRKIKQFFGLQGIQDVLQLAVFAAALDAGGWRAVVTSFVRRIRNDNMLWGVFEYDIQHVCANRFSQIRHAIEIAPYLAPVVSNHFSAAHGAAHPSHQNFVGFHLKAIGRAGLS